MLKHSRINVKALAAIVLVCCVSIFMSAGSALAQDCSDPANLIDCEIKGDFVICDGGSTELCGPDGSFRYVWLGPNGFTADTQCVTVTDPGEYDLEVLSEFGCTTNCKAQVEIASSSCEITGDTTVCEPGVTTELCGPEGAASYAWSGPDGFTADTRCVDVSVGDYVLVITTADGCECRAQATVVAVGDAGCEITGDTSVCAPGDLTELCGPEGAASYAWSGPDGFTADTRCINVSVGVYTLTTATADGCECRSQAEVVATGAPSCEIKGDLLICDGETTELCGPAGAASYSWTGPNGFTADTECVTVSDAGEYDLDVVYESGCTSNCKTIVEVEDCGGHVNCPHTVGYWSAQCAQRNNGSTKFTRAEVTQIAEAIDAKTDFFDWTGKDAFDEFCAVMNPSRPMTNEKQAKRQFAGFMANICTGDLGLIATNGEEIFLDLSTPIDCGGIEAGNLGDLMDAVDAMLGGDDPDYSSIIPCVDDVNNGRGIGEVCGKFGGDDEDEDGDDVLVAPVTSAKLSTYPNPFSQQTEIKLEMPFSKAGVSVQVNVYDVSGRLVAQLADGLMGGGTQTISWDGMGSKGQRVASGVYYVHARVGNDTAVVQRLLRVK